MNEITTVSPVVFERNGVVYANSQDVATFFRKQHNHVLRDIRALIAEQPEWGASNFGPSSYLSEQNKELPCFEMTRSGFSVLVMGFTGSDALTFKIRYDQQFNAMEQALRGPVIPTLADRRAAALELNAASRAMDHIVKTYGRREAAKFLPSIYAKAGLILNLPGSHPQGELALIHGPQLDRPPEQKLAGRILGIIRRAGDSGVTKTQLIQKTQGIKAADRDLILEVLVKHEAISTKTHSRSIHGRPSTVYIAEARQ